MKISSAQDVKLGTRLALVAAGLAIGAGVGILAPLAAHAATTTVYANHAPLFQNEWLSSSYPGYSNTTSSSANITINGDAWVGQEHGISRNVTTFASYGDVTGQPNTTISWKVPKDKVESSCWWTWKTHVNLPASAYCTITH